MGHNYCSLLYQGPQACRKHTQMACGCSAIDRLNAEPRLPDVGLAAIPLRFRFRGSGSTAPAVR
jgi:hypothetical protein